MLKILTLASLNLTILSAQQCGCVRCKFQTRQHHRIVEDHVRRYGVEDIGQYTTWFESQVRGLNIGEKQLEMMLDPRVASVHHRAARRQAMGGVYPCQYLDCT